MTTIRMTVEQSMAFPPCVLNTTLPSPNCTDLSFYINITLLWGRIMLGKDYRYKVIPSHGYEFTSGPNATNQSALDLIEREETDVIYPLMILLPSEYYYHFRVRAHLLFVFFYGMGFAVLSNYFFAVFSQMEQNQLNVTNTSDFVKELESGEFVLVGESKGIFKSLPASYDGPKSKHEVRSIIVDNFVHSTNFEETKRLLHKSSHRHVLVTLEFSPNKMRLLSSNRNLIVNCDMREKGVLKSVAYVSPLLANNVKNISVTKTEIFGAILRRCHSEYFQGYIFTEKSDEADIKTSHTLAFSQVAALFQMAAFGLAGSGTVFIVEKAYYGLLRFTYAYATRA